MKDLKKEILGNELGEPVGELYEEKPFLVPTSPGEKEVITYEDWRWIHNYISSAIDRAYEAGRESVKVGATEIAIWKEEGSKETLAKVKKIIEGADIHSHSDLLIKGRDMAVGAILEKLDELKVDKLIDKK